MKVSWLRDQDGRLRRELKPHMGRRLKGFDYSQKRIYEITVVLKDRQSILGQLVHNGEGGWSVEPSEVGKAVLACWREITVRWPQVKLIECALMPDHFHGILFVTEELPKGKTLGNIIGSFKSRSSSEALRILGRIFAVHGEEQNADGSVGACARERARFWEEGYVDVILFGEGQLDRMIAYLRDNPRRLGIKRANPELFKVRRELDVKEIGCFSAIGNPFLLNSPKFHQIQVSRRYFSYARDTRGKILKNKPPKVATCEFDEKLRLALSAAKDGAVLVSPCISEGEREIARRAFEEGAKIITLSNKGFSPLYKPGGKLFEKCAAGNLLMLAPIAWPYQVAEKPITRMDALILNRIAQMISRDNAIEIDYKGCVFADIEMKTRAALSMSSL